MANSKTFQVLTEFSRRCLSAARGLPAQSEIIPTHTLLCFSVLSIDMAVAIDEVLELLETPACTKLPRVKDWVCGVANVRGRLLPVIDFASFLGGRRVGVYSLQRTLVIEEQGIFVGLIVDQVFGIRHFKANTYENVTAPMPRRIAGYMEGYYRDGTRNWYLFRPSRVIEDTAFMEVAS